MKQKNWRHNRLSLVLLLALFAAWSPLANGAWQANETAALNAAYHQLKSAYLNLLKPDIAPRQLAKNSYYFGYETGAVNNLSSIKVLLNNIAVAEFKLGSKENMAFAQGGLLPLYGANMADESLLSLLVTDAKGLQKKFEFVENSSANKTSVTIFKLAAAKKITLSKETIFDPGIGESGFIVQEALYDLHTKGEPAVLLKYIGDDRIVYSSAGEQRSLAYIYTKAALEFGVPEYALAIKFDAKTHDNQTKLEHIEYLLRSQDMATAQRIIDSLHRFGSNNEKNQALYLQSIIYLRHNELAQLKKLLPSFKGPSQEQAIVALNLSSALALDGKVKQALQIAKKTNVPAAKSEINRSLEAKKNLYIGTFYNWLGQGEKSKTHLKRVGSGSSGYLRALLTLGWSEIGKQQVSDAYNSWQQVLNTGQKDSKAVQESLLLVPYALARMNRFEQASGAYLQAIEVYKQQLNNIDYLLRRFTNKKMAIELVTKSAQLNEKKLALLQLAFGKDKQNYMAQLLEQKEVPQALDKILRLENLLQELATASLKVKRSSGFHRLNSDARHLQQQYSAWFSKMATLIFEDRKKILQKHLAQAEFLLAENYQRMALGTDNN